MADLLFEKKKIVIVGKKQKREENSRDEKQLGRNIHQNDRCEDWKE